jgi:hypothetical protein
MNGKPLDNRRRRRLFLVAAAVVAVVAVALSLLRGREPVKPEVVPAPAPRVQSAPPGAPLKRPAPRGLSRAADRRRVAAVKRGAAPVARRFAVAFIAYGDGNPSRTVRARLRATATTPFARRLLSTPPRLHGRVVPGRVVALQVSEDRSPAGLPVLITVRRGRRTTQLPLLLERKDARWLVADLAG